MAKKESGQNKGKFQAIDTIITVLMLLSGIGILYFLFSNEAVAYQNVQLAPPVINYWIYILPIVFICGAIWLLLRKRKAHIPLSF